MSILLVDSFKLKSAFDARQLVSRSLFYMYYENRTRGTQSANKKRAKKQKKIKSKKQKSAANH